MRASPSGAELYALVEEYAALGHHRSGTAVDAATAAWMADHLRHRGLGPALEPVEFDMWTATGTVTVDGEPIEHLALPYSWLGAVDTTAVLVEEVDTHSGGVPDILDAAVAALPMAGHDVAVLATRHPHGSLVGVNRRIELRDGPPVVLIAGRDADRARAGTVRVTLAASLSVGTTTNIVAGNGVPGPPLILTTPLNGWFTCAGERGTGISVLLALVDRFRHLPLLVVATGGHELSYLGGHAWVDATGIRPRAIVHVGASIAVEESDDTGRRRLIAGRLAMTNLADDQAGPLREALAPIGLDPATAVAHWLGEGEAFSKLDAPLLSFTGAGVDFHTPEDVPARVTSPGALERVATAIGDAADALHDLAG